MAKSTTGGARNGDRSNGKASKKNPGRHGAGSRRSPLDEGTKIALGKGLYVRYERMNSEGVRTMVKKGNSKGKD